MYHKIEDCPRCFTLIGKGLILKWKTKRKLKRDGHLIFDETKWGWNIWQMVVSTRTYKGATYGH